MDLYNPLPPSPPFALSHLAQDMRSNSIQATFHFIFHEEILGEDFSIHLAASNGCDATPPPPAPVSLLQSPAAILRSNKFPFNICSANGSGSFYKLPSAAGHKLDYTFTLWLNGTWTQL